MIVGFTGTQHGMTKAQRAAFRRLVLELGVTTFHHGDCVGSDAQAHNTVRKRTTAKLVIHPPSNEGKRAFSKHATFTYKAAPYLERNRNIVNRCQLLVATPGGMSEELRSGTWFTVRYARKIKRPIVLVYPDGTTEKVAGRNTDPLHELRQ